MPTPDTFEEKNMKHSDMIAEFRKKFKDVNGIYYFGNGSELEQWLLTAFTTIQERTEEAVLERVENEVIGEDEKPDDDWAGRDIINCTRNGLRKEQRQSLNKMKGNV